LIRRKWDIIHTADFDAFVPALLAARLKRKPIIYDIYDVYADSVSLPKLARWIVLHVERYFAKLTDVLIMTSEGHRHRLGLDSSGKVNLIYNICKYIAGDAKPRDNRNFRIFYAGTLYKSALLNLDKIIMAISNLNDVELAIAGYGDDYEDDLKALVRHNNIKNVQFLGKLPRKDVLQETMNSDLLFVLYDPALPINAISLPHKLFDALTYGKPILVPKDTVLGRFVTTHDCGVPVNCRSPEDIKAAITRLKNDSEFYNRLAVGARKAYEQEYNWQVMKRRLLGVYDKILSKKECVP
jgi:glycosyltransferase involved in cell wall biosynthesis